MKDPAAANVAVMRTMGDAMRDLNAKYTVSLDGQDLPHMSDDELIFETPATTASLPTIDNLMSDLNAMSAQMPSHIVTMQQDGAFDDAAARAQTYRSAAQAHRTSAHAKAIATGRAIYADMTADECARHERAAEALGKFVDTIGAEFGVPDPAWLFAIIAEATADETQAPLICEVLDYIRDVSARADAAIVRI